MGYKENEYIKMELTWLFQYADSDCGIQSNWNSMVNAACSPGSTYSDHYNSHIMRAVEKRRDIENVLWKLDQHHQNCLFAMFGSIHIPHSILNILGSDLAGPALCTSLVPLKELEKVCEKALLGKATAKDKLLISEVRIEAETNKATAFAKYKTKRNERRNAKSSQ